MRWIAIFILMAFVIAGCTQSETGSYQTQQYLKDADVRILGTSWAFEDQCQYGNKSVAFVNVECKKGLICEVYVNDVKSNYEGGLQPCGELTVTDTEVSEKPDFVALQNGNKYYYIRRDRSKNVEICCSYLNNTTKGLDRDNEICNTIRLEAQCPEMVAKGFTGLTVDSWEFHFDGTLSLAIKNNNQYNAMIRRFYFNNRSSVFSTLVPSNSLSSTISVTNGPHGTIGSSYAITLTIEYYLVTNTSGYFNSTGTLTGTYY